MPTLGGWALGLVLFLPLFALGGMGAGDVKLLAAFGAWMGAWNVVQTALAAGVIGGVLALGLALSRNYVAQAFTNVWSLLLFWRASGLRPHPTISVEAGTGPRLAYAIPRGGPHPLDRFSSQLRWDPVHDSSDLGLTGTGA